MRRRRSLALLRCAVGAVLLLACAARAQAAGPLDLKVEYSADVLAGTGDNIRPGKLWRTPQSVRLETFENSRPQTVIVRVDRSLAWLLLPEVRLAIETDLSGLALTQALFGRSEGFTFASLGPDTIEGQRTTRWRIDSADPKAGWFRGFVWSRADGVVMKIEGEGEHRGRRGYVHLLFRNIAVGRQDASLFEPPAEFRRLQVSETMIDALLKGLEQMQRLRSGAPR